MTTLAIYPKFEDKTAKITGTVSAGEHVDVRIVGGASLLPSSTLRLRITCGKTIAVFPQPESNDAWATEGGDIKCHLNLNTVQAEIALRHGCVSCHAILEQTADDEHTLEPTLFFDDEFEILPWRKIPGETTPFNLDAYPDVIASFERRMTEFGAVVNQTKELVTQAKNAAVGANNRAVDAERSAQEAEKSALAAQRALDGINGQVEDARNAALSAEEAAETADESASASAESAASAAQSAATAVAVVAKKADLVGGKVPASQLPSYVDDVLEFESVSDFPETGETGKIYIAKDTNKQYRWSGTQYVEIGGGGAGEDENAVHYYLETKTEGQKAKARQNIGAMSAETPIPSVGGKLPMRPLPKYLHAISFDDTYPADSAWLYAQLGPSDIGRCSAVRRGDKLYRNYDWTFDDAAEFVVRMSGNATRFASVGVASVGSRLTENDVMSAVNSRYYKCLPGMTLDGINEKGVVCEINVDGGPKTGWHGDADEDGIHILAAVRWVLDHCETAQQAAEYLAENIIQPQGEMNFHFMVADATKTYIVENGDCLEITDGINILTNYSIIDGSLIGGGKERFLLLRDEEPITSVWFTNAYQSGNDWDSDFESTEQHAAAIAQWAEQGTDKESHRGKTTSSGKAWWQSVHTTEYDFAAKTMKVAVQEVDDWYTFAVGQTNVDLTPIEEQIAALQSGKIGNANGRITVVPDPDDAKLKIAGTNASIEMTASSAETSDILLTGGDGTICLRVGNTGGAPSIKKGGKEVATEEQVEAKRDKTDLTIVRGGEEWSPWVDGNGLERDIRHVLGDDWEEWPTGATAPVAWEATTAGSGENATELRLVGSSLLATRHVIPETDTIAGMSDVAEIVDEAVTIPFRWRSNSFTTEGGVRFLVAVGGNLAVTMHTPEGGVAEIFECRFDGHDLDTDKSVTFTGATVTTMDADCGTVKAGKVSLMSAFWNGTTWDVNWKVEG